MVAEMIKREDPTLTERQVEYVLCWLELKRKVCHLTRINDVEVADCIGIMRTFSPEFNDALAATFDR